MMDIKIGNDLIQELTASDSYMDYSVIRRVDEKMQAQVDKQNSVMDCFQMFDTVIEAINAFNDALNNGSIDVSKLNRSEIEVCDSANIWLPCGYATKNSRVIVKDVSYDTIRQFALKGKLVPQRKSKVQGGGYTSYWTVGRYYDTSTHTADLTVTYANSNVNIYDSAVNDYAHGLMRTPYVDTGASMRTSPVLTVDCDDSLLQYRLLLLKYYHIPLPQVITINPMKGTFQMHWIMSKCYYRFSHEDMPELSKLNDDKHARMFDEVRWSLTYLLHGDVGFTNNRRRNILDNVCSIRLVLSDYVNVNTNRTHSIHPYRVNRNGVIINNGTGGSPDYAVNTRVSINVHPTVINPVDKYDVDMLHAAVNQAGVLLSKNRLYSYYNMKAHLYESTGCITDDVMSMRTESDNVNDNDDINDANSSVSNDSSSDSMHVGSDSMDSTVNNAHAVSSGANAGNNVNAYVSNAGNHADYDNARLSTVNGIVDYVNEKYGKQFTYKNGSTVYMIPEGSRNDAVFNFAQIAYYHGFDAKVFISKLRLAKGNHSYGKREMIRTLKSVHDYYYYMNALPDELITDASIVSTVHNVNASNADDEYALMYSLFAGAGVNSGNSTVVSANGGFKVNPESIFKKYYKDKLGSDKQLVITAGYGLAKDKTKTKTKTKTGNHNGNVNSNPTVSSITNATNDSNAEAVNVNSIGTMNNSNIEAGNAHNCNADVPITADAHATVNAPDSQSSSGVLNANINDNMSAYNDSNAGIESVTMSDSSAYSDIADNQPDKHDLQVHIDENSNVMLGSLSLEGLTGADLKRAVYKHNARVNGSKGGCRHSMKQIQTRTINGMRTSADKILKAILMRDSMLVFITKIGDGIISDFNASKHVDMPTTSSSQESGSTVTLANGSVNLMRTGSNAVYADIRKARRSLSDRNLSKITGYSETTVHRKYQEFMRMMYEYVKHVPVNIGNVIINDCSKTRKYDDLFEYVKHDRRLYGAALISAAVKSGLMLTLAVQGLSFKPYADDNGLNGKWLGIIGRNANVNITGYNDRTPEQVITDGLNMLSTYADNNDVCILINEDTVMNETDGNAADDKNKGTMSITGTDNVSRIVADNNDYSDDGIQQELDCEHDSDADYLGTDVISESKHDGFNPCSHEFIDRIILCEQNDDISNNRNATITVSDATSDSYDAHSDYDYTVFTDSISMSLAYQSFSDYHALFTRVCFTDDVNADMKDRINALNSSISDELRVLLTHDVSMDGFDSTDEVFIDDDLFDAWLDYHHELNEITSLHVLNGNDEYSVVHRNMFTNLVSMIKHRIMSNEPVSLNHDVSIVESGDMSIGADSDGNTNSTDANHISDSHDYMVESYMRKHGITHDSHDTDAWLDWFTDDEDDDFDL